MQLLGHTTEESQQTWLTADRQQSETHLVNMGTYYYTHAAMTFIHAIIIVTVTVGDNDINDHTDHMHWLVPTTSVYHSLAKQGLTCRMESWCCFMPSISSLLRCINSLM